MNYDEFSKAFLSTLALVLAWVDLNWPKFMNLVTGFLVFWMVLHLLLVLLLDFTSELRISKMLFSMQCSLLKITISPTEMFTIGTSPDFVQSLEFFLVRPKSGFCLDQNNWNWKFEKMKFRKKWKIGNGKKRNFDKTKNQKFENSKFSIFRILIFQILFLEILQLKLKKMENLKNWNFQKWNIGNWKKRNFEKKTKNQKFENSKFSIFQILNFFKFSICEISFF